jgi:D-alanine-D-alanine ligase
MSVTPERQRLFEIVRQIGKGLHIAVEPTHRWHSSDICFVPQSVPAIDGMGPIGGGERTQDEHILRSSLVERAAVLAMVIHRCAKGDDQ